MGSKFESISLFGEIKKLCLYPLLDHTGENVLSALCFTLITIACINYVCFLYKHTQLLCLPLFIAKPYLLNQAHYHYCSYQIIPIAIEPAI